MSKEISEMKHRLQMLEVKTETLEGQIGVNNELLRKIQSHGIDIYISGGRGVGCNANLSYKDYADLMRRSKISLNPQFGHWSPHRKGRTFEIAASRSFALTDHPEILSGKDGHYFDIENHLGIYNENNLIEKIIYWLNNDKERIQRSENAYNYWLKNYSPKPWWNKVLNYCTR